MAATGKRLRREREFRRNPPRDVAAEYERCRVEFRRQVAEDEAALERRLGFRLSVGHPPGRVARMSLRSRLRLLRDLATTIPGMLAVSVFLAIGAAALWAIIANEAILTLARKPETYLAILTAAVMTLLAFLRGPRADNQDTP